MEHTKKMVLVDPRMLGETPASAPTVTNITQPESLPIDMTLQGLERGLQNIMNRTDLPADQKVDLYSHHFQQYLTMKKKQTEVYRRPSEVVLGGQTSLPLPAEQRQSELLENEIVNSVPKQNQKQARLLMQRIKESSAMGWNARGELVVDGVPVQGSNIVDLVGDLVRKRKNFDPVGWQTLAEKLRDDNVPADLVRNPLRLDYMRSGQSTSRAAAAAAAENAASGNAVRFASLPRPPSLPRAAVSSGIRALEKTPVRGRGRGRGVRSIANLEDVLPPPSLWQQFPQYARTPPGRFVAPERAPPRRLQWHTL